MAPHLPTQTPPQGAAGPRSSRSRLSQRRKAASCLPAVDVDKLRRECPQGDPKAHCRSLVLDNVCLVQETFVVYDPENAGRNPSGLMKAR